MGRETLGNNLLLLLYEVLPTLRRHLKVVDGELGSLIKVFCSLILLEAKLGG